MREDQTTRLVLRVHVRYFAAARAAAGIEEERLDVPVGASIDDLVAILTARGPELARILLRCSFLCDGLAVRDRAKSLRTNQIVDVLPPFAGG